MSTVLNVALVPRGVTVDPAEVANVAAALSIQIARDFTPIWGINATVSAFTTPSKVPVGYWPIYIEDPSKMPPGAGGVHMDRHKQPYALIETGDQWSLDASHECLEMLVDPYGNKMQANPLLQQAIDLGQPAQQVRYIVEVCDPIEDAQYGYQINGVLVSDFLTPHYYDPVAGPGVQYDFMRAITAPRQVLTNGYISWINQDGNAWQLMNFLGQDGTLRPILRDLSQNALFHRVLQAEALRPAVDRVMQLTDRPAMHSALTHDQLQAFQERTRVVSYAAQAHAERLNVEIAPIAGALAVQKPVDTTSDIPHDPYAAILIDHNFLEDVARKATANFAAELEEAKLPAWTALPWPAGTAPTVLPDSLGPELPPCDVVLITYTADEANAMAALLTPGFLAMPPKSSPSGAWASYTNKYASYVPDLLHGSSPALQSHNLGLYKLIQLGGKKVLCFKSSLHLARDGKSIPIMRLVQQIVGETKASLVITTGTAGGIGGSVQLGDAAITTEVRFDFIRMFAKEPYNKTTLTSSFALTSNTYLNLANTQLIPVNSGHLASSPIPPNRTPQIGAGATVFGTPNVCVTTDGFLYDDAADTDHLQGLGCMVEMDDAVVALAIDQLGASAPQWLSIRNASDPQMPAGATKQESSDIYLKYGFYTSFTSVLACWAAVLGS